ncbi:MAG: ATP synthase F0 subunit B [Candidatus Aminicenantes bacterium]|jgi:F-type H+-transporting ATPase subunit b
MGRKKILLLLLCLPLLIFMSAEEEEHSSALIDFLGKTVNFIILFGGLTYLLYKPIRGFLEKRSREIQFSLKDAKDSKEEAEQKLKEIETRMAGLEKEIEKMMKEADSEGRKEKEKTLQVAQKETERIKHFARQEIDGIIRSGLRELREHTALLATSLAKKNIQKKMSPELQSRLINISIERLDLLDEKSNSGQKIHSRAD